MEIKMSVKPVMTNQSEITVYINDSMSATNILCIIQHLCYYGTMTSLSTHYPYEEIKIFMMAKDVKELVNDLENEGFSITIA